MLKSIMKRILLSFLAVVAMATVASAQQTTLVVEVEERPRGWRGYETNRFWDNWELAAGGGASMLQMTESFGKDPGKFLNRVGWNANVALTKWIVPVVGMRLQVDGGEFQNYSFAPKSYGEGIYKTPYLYVHGDILINMTNWIGGFNPRRVYSAIPYVGFGYTAMSWTDKSVGDYNGEFAFTSGFLSKFHITPQWDIELDLRSWIFAEQQLPKEIRGDNRIACAISASLGVAYRFNKRVWTPAYSQVDVDGYIAAIAGLEEELLATDAALLVAAKDVKTLETDNARLKSDLAAAKANTPKTNYVCVGEGVVFFHIGEATLSDYARATLDNYVAAMASNDAKIVVTGYADKETGSAERNEQLSMERAQNVAAYLTAHGIDASRITTEWVGDTETAFSSPETPIVNRCVLIK